MTHHHSFITLSFLPCFIPTACHHTAYSTLHCMYTATTRGDKVGEVARSTGSAAVTAYGKAKDVAEKYHVSEKISSATKSTVRNED